MVKIGMARQDLETALRPANKVMEERVEAIALFAEGHEHSALWISLDFMDFNLCVVETLKAAVNAETKLAIDHVHILTTHNHSGGTPDLPTLARLTGVCARHAMDSAVPARMRSVMTRTLRQLSYMRRIDVPELDGVTTLFNCASARDNFDASPHIECAIRSIREGNITYRDFGPTNRQYRPFAPGDPTVAAVEFSDMNGNPIGSFLRFAAHATCGSPPDTFASDYPWHVRHTIESSYGGVSLFFNGPCADIAPEIEAKCDGSAQRIGESLAHIALQALDGLPFEPLTVFDDAMTTLFLPVRREVVENYVDQPEIMPEPLPERRRYLEKSLLRNTLPFLEEKYREGELLPGDLIPVHLGFARFNDFLLAAFPGETFRATGDALKEAYPLEKFCTVTEHERTVMYLPPAHDFERGGYETVCMVTAPGAEGILRQGAIDAASSFLKRRTDHCVL